MKIEWLQQAINDLKHIEGYIAQYNKSASERVVQTILTLVQTQLSAFPQSCRIGRVADTRELVITRTPFVLVYRVTSSEIQILSVRHTSQLWPTHF